MPSVTLSSRPELPAGAAGVTAEPSPSAGINEVGSFAATPAAHLSSYKLSDAKISAVVPALAQPAVATMSHLTSVVGGTTVTSGVRYQRVQNANGTVSFVASTQPEPDVVGEQGTTAASAQPAAQPVVGEQGAIVAPPTPIGYKVVVNADSTMSYISAQPAAQPVVGEQGTVAATPTSIGYKVVANTDGAMSFIGAQPAAQPYVVGGQAAVDAQPQHDVVAEQGTVAAAPAPIGYKAVTNADGTMSYISAAPTSTIPYDGPVVAAAPVYGVPGVAAVGGPCNGGPCAGMPSGMALPGTALFSPMPMMGRPQPPSKLTNGIPDPSTIEQQKVHYDRSLDQQLVQGIQMLEQQGEEQKRLLREEVARRKEEFFKQMDQQLQEQELAVEKAADYRMMELQRAAAEQKATLEQQSNHAKLEYEQKKVAEEFAGQQYEHHKRAYEKEVEMQRELHKNREAHQLQARQMEEKYRQQSSMLQRDAAEAASGFGAPVPNLYGPGAVGAFPSGPVGGAAMGGVFAAMGAHMGAMGGVATGGAHMGVPGAQGGSYVPPPRM